MIVHLEIKFNPKSRNIEVYKSQHIFIEKYVFIFIARVRRLTLSKWKRFHGKPQCMTTIIHRSKDINRFQTLPVSSKYTIYKIVVQLWSESSSDRWHRLICKFKIINNLPNIVNNRWLCCFVAYVSDFFVLFSWLCVVILIYSLRNISLFHLLLVHLHK